MPAEAGRRVIAYGKQGVILADRGNYNGGELDEDPKKRIRNYHPTHEIKYGDMAKPFRSRNTRFCRSGTTGTRYVTTAKFESL